MRIARAFIMGVAVALALGVVSVPYASAIVHGGGGTCKNCHTMHNSYEGEEMGGGSFPHLLRAASSDMCLGCHGPATTEPLYDSIKVMSADPLAPIKGGVGAGGGDFAFLTEDNLNDGHAGAANPILGERGGHNVVAPGVGLDADTTNTESPGGSYPSADFGCVDCHEPHGGPQFRFLHYSGSIDPPAVFSATDEVIADSISVHDEETNNNHNAYMQNMSEWCGACHGDFHSETSGRLVHPTRSIGSDFADKYNNYNGTDQPSSATPYLAAVPVEWDSATNTTSYTADISGTSKVMCLSCHRAHGSSAPTSGRWDFNITEWSEEGVESGSWAIPNPYPAVGGHQRSLCNKCHVQDKCDLGLGGPGCPTP